MTDELEIYVDGKKETLLELLSEMEEIPSVDGLEGGKKEIVASPQGEIVAKSAGDILDEMARGIVEVDEEIAEMMRKMGYEEFGIRHLWALAVAQELVQVVKGKRKGGSTLAEIGKMLGYGAKKESSENSRVAEAFIRAIGEVASSLLEQREEKRKIVDGEVRG